MFNYCAFRFQGEYDYKNVSLDVDKFGPAFSLSTEKYWDQYWKMYITVYTENKLKYLFLDIEFYFIQFRSQQRQN